MKIVDRLHILNIIVSNKLRMYDEVMEYINEKDILIDDFDDEFVEYF